MIGAEGDKVAENNKRDKDATKEVLIESFKEVMLEISFDDITIKKITDRAGLIRPTFYNHFPDKYAIFESILDGELFETLYSLVDLNLMEEAVSVIFVYFDKNKEFYRRAFEIEGQNSFEEIFTRKLINFYKHVLSHYQLKNPNVTKSLTIQNIAEYYAIGLVYIIKSWCEYDGEEYEVEAVIKSYEYLVSHALTDFFEEK